MLTALYGTQNYRNTREETILQVNYLYNHVVLTEKASTRVTNSCKCSTDISLASSSLAMNNDWRTEYALGSDHLPIVLSITCDLITHTTPQRTFSNYRKADWASFKDDIELKLKKQQRPTNVYHAKKDLNESHKRSGWQAYLTRKNFKKGCKISSRSSKAFWKTWNSKKTSRGPQIMQLNLEINSSKSKAQKVDQVCTKTHSQR